MASSVTIELHIGNAIPNAGETDTQAIIALWHKINQFFEQRAVPIEAKKDKPAKDYLITLDASQLLKAFEHAQLDAGSFNKFRENNISLADAKLGANLKISVGLNDGDIEEKEAYRVAMVFLQQLVIATNIVLPGAIQLLSLRFIGPTAHLYEPQEYGAKVFYDARMCAQNNAWPKLTISSFAQVWHWLAECGTSEHNTALKGINKVLFTLLKIAAQQNQQYSSRKVLLVPYLLEILLHCRHTSDINTPRNRVRLVLGELPESADCFRELYEIRDSFLSGERPVQRPELIYHSSEQELKDQLTPNNNPLGRGTALALGLIQDLIEHNAQRYEFTEHFAYKD